MGVNGIYGLSGSGMDIESMVKVGMLTRQKQYDKMQQTYTKNEWQKQAYNEIYANLTTFNNSTLSPYKMESTMNAKTATTTSDAITVTANGSAPILNHKIDVKSLSSAAYLTSTNKLTRYDSASNTTTTDQTSIKLADVLMQGLQKNVSDGTTRANVHDIGDDSTDANLHELKETAFELKISDGTTNSKGELIYSTISYSYGDLLNGKTFNDLASDINSLGINVRASYDAVNDSLSFYNKEGGAANTITFDVDDSTDAGARTKAFMQNLHLFQSQNGVLIGSDGEEVTDTSTATNYFGSGNVEEVNAASISTQNAVTLNDNSVADTTSHLAGILFDDFTYSDDATSVNYKLVGSDETSTVQETETAISFTINDVEVSYTFADLFLSNSTQFDVQSLLDNINDENTGVTATLDSDGFLNLATNDTGSDSKISITANNDFTAAFLNRLGFKDDNSDSSDTIEFTTGTETSAVGTGNSNEAIDTSAFISLAGTNGVAVIDGVTYDNITDNKVTAAGVTYNINDVTNGAVNVTVKQDTEAIIDKVKSFVEDYNKLLSGLYEKYDEKQYKDYKPLTASQKEQMKDEQIEKWEEKAKSGILYHDQTLGKIITNMREAVSTPIADLNGKYNSIFALGISTTGTKGQLKLDEDKLRTALNEEPDSVYNIFGHLSKDDDFNSNGVAQRLGDVFTTGLKSVRDRAGLDDTANDDSDLGQLMRNLLTRMSDFKKMMDSFENKLYKKYDAMEVALSRLGVQLNYITGGQ